MELHLLKVHSLEHNEAYEYALTCIKKNKKCFIDDLQREDLVARMNLKMGNKDLAIKHYENLLQLNSCNYETYYKILKAHGVDIFDKFGNQRKSVTADEQAIIKKTFDVYQVGFPKVDAPNRLAMKWLDGEDFSSRLNTFILPLLRKGVPSVVQDLKEFYTNEAKIDLIEKQLMEYLASMTASSVLVKGDPEEDPTVHLWLLYFIANHFLFKRDVDQALLYINKAIEHTPTLIDNYTMKGKIMQLAGNRSQAAHLFEEARVLDTADRALNAIAACYAVKAGNVQKGEDTIGIFFKDLGYDSNVHDNQCIWFEQVCGSYHFKGGAYREALKEYSHSMTHI